ncbi:MAG: hypothetical protein EOP39_07985 [Rubrivivax sp.]|nr:MAG: hypothetical protein EOP39_07985 [Rubrivivax sp.]
MTDQELLERAAKAAGYTSNGYGELCGGDPCLLLKEADFTGMWAPLSDDGDALRLAVKLKIPLQFPDWANAVRTWGPKAGDPFDEEGNDDLAAATRRAIVMAAASLA